MNMIIQYLENKQNVDGLFDDYICAFKINKQIIDPRRTTNNKTYNELIRCLLVPRKTEIILEEKIPKTKLTATEIEFSDKTFNSVFCLITFNLKISDHASWASCCKNIGWNIFSNY
jgi:hypothetical protein